MFVTEISMFNLPYIKSTVSQLFYFFQKPAVQWNVADLHLELGSHGAHPVHNHGNRHPGDEASEREALEGPAHVVHPQRYT